MILGAAALVLLGLGLFVGGVVTGETGLYWACVAACALAAVLLLVARVRAAGEADDADDAGPRAPDGVHPTTDGAHAAPEVEEPDPDEPVAAEPEAVAEPQQEAEPQHEAEPDPDEPVAAEPEAAAEPQHEAGPQPAAVVRPVHGDHAEERPASRRGAHEPREGPAEVTAGEPGEEDVLVTDLLLVVDLDDEVLVVDEHPRYHVAGCSFLEGRVTVPLPMVEARTDGFTPCGVCRPVRQLARTERSRRATTQGA